MDNYNPSRLWVFKVRKDGTIAIDIFSCIDDGRLTTLFLGILVCFEEDLLHSYLIWITRCGNEKN